MSLDRHCDQKRKAILRHQGGLIGHRLQNVTDFPSCTDRCWGSVSTASPMARVADPLHASLLFILQRNLCMPRIDVPLPAIPQLPGVFRPTGTCTSTFPARQCINRHPVTCQNDPVTRQPLLPAGHTDETALTDEDAKRVAWFRAAQGADTTELSKLIAGGIDVNMAGPGKHPAISHVLHAFIDGVQNQKAIAAVIMAPGFDATKVPEGDCGQIATAHSRHATGRKLQLALWKMGDPALLKMLQRSDQLTTQRLGMHDPLDPDITVFSDKEALAVAVGWGKQMELLPPWPDGQQAWFTAALDGDLDQLKAQGIDVNAKDQLGRSALWLALHASQDKTVEWLLTHSALDISPDSAGPFYRELSLLHRYLHQSAGLDTPDAERQMEERQARVSEVLPSLLSPPHAKVASTLWKEPSFHKVSGASCLSTLWNCSNVR